MALLRGRKRWLTVKKESPGMGPGLSFPHRHTQQVDRA